MVEDVINNTEKLFQVIKMEEKCYFTIMLTACLWSWNLCQGVLVMQMNALSFITRSKAIIMFTKPELPCETEVLC